MFFDLEIFFLDPPRLGEIRLLESIKTKLFGESIKKIYVIGFVTPSLDDSKAYVNGLLASVSVIHGVIWHQGGHSFCSKK